MRVPIYTETHTHIHAHVHTKAHTYIHVFQDLINDNMAVNSLLILCIVNIYNIIYKGFILSLKRFILSYLDMKLK